MEVNKDIHHQKKRHAKEIEDAFDDAYYYMLPAHIADQCNVHGVMYNVHGSMMHEWPKIYTSMRVSPMPKRS
jgi:hypothetical protein